MNPYNINLKPFIERVIDLNGSMDAIDFFEYLMEALPGDLVLDYHLSGRALSELQDIRVSMTLNEDFKF